MEKNNTLAARAGAVSIMLGSMLFGGLFLAGGAHAQGDPGADAIEGFGAKVTTYGTAMIGVVVIAVGIFLAVKYIRKAVSAA